MANNFNSNTSEKLARVFLEKFECSRVHSKNVNTQLLEGKYTPDTGGAVSFKRPTDYAAKETADGDISGGNRSDIVVGKATGVVQNMITVDVEWTRVEQSLEMDQLDDLLAPMARRIVTTYELNFAAFMMKNAGLLAGTPGTPATTWDHIAEADAMLEASGVPMDAPWYYTVNPFTKRNLASNQRSLGAGGSAGAMITEAHKKATVTEMFAGFDRVMSATTLPSYTTDSPADRAGTLSGNPTVTYVAAKDSMTQVLPVTAFGANLEVKAGEKIQIAGRNRLNLATRTLMLDENGAEVLFTGTVTEDVTLNGSGAGNITVTGPAIFEAAGAFNTVDSAPVSGDVVTLLGSNSSVIQPNLFWHRDAFGIGSIPIPKLYATDTLATTEDGLQIRVSKYSDGDANKQIVRFDFHPAFCAFNSFFAGHGFG